MNNMLFITYYNTYETALKNFALKLTRNITEAEDLVQEAALKAYKGFHTFEQNSNFKSWAFTIIKNTFISKYRRKRNRNEINAELGDIIHVYDQNSYVGNKALENIRLSELNKAIESLTEKSKIPFLMSIQGYQYNEIAEELQIPMGTVKSRINFARTKLKETLMNI